MLYLTLCNEECIYSPQRWAKPMMAINAHQLAAGKRLKSHDSLKCSSFRCRPLRYARYLRPLSGDDDDVGSFSWGSARRPKGKYSSAIGLLAQSRTGAPQVVMLECERNDLMLAIS
ncbi:hypothetical protein QL285_051803 [Trifolium repens]|nr:hypothetical protein QL285_051803 [Trifolium repens]